MTKSYRCQFYYKVGEDFTDCLDAAAAIEGIAEDGIIAQAFRLWADRMEASVVQARKIAEACVGLKLEVEGDGHFAALFATDEESAAVLDSLVEADTNDLFVEESDEDYEEDDDDDEVDDDRLDPANYVFWSPAESGPPTSDYNVFVAETSAQAIEVLRKWTSDERVIVALLPAMVEAVCWQDPTSEDVIALFPLGMAKEELITHYVAFLARE